MFMFAAVLRGMMYGMFIVFICAIVKSIIAAIINKDE